MAINTESSKFCPSCFVRLPANEVNTKLLEACKGLFKLIEDGELVRNTQNDDSPTWALEHLGFVVTLKDAEQAIAQATEMK